jgi:hypothetical protein
MPMVNESVQLQLIRVLVVLALEQLLAQMVTRLKLTALMVVRYQQLVLVLALTKIKYRSTLAYSPMKYRGLSLIQKIVT